MSMTKPITLSTLAIALGCTFFSGLLLAQAEEPLEGGTFVHEGETVEITADYVRENIGDLAKNVDLSKFIL